MTTHQFRLDLDGALPEQHNGSSRTRPDHHLTRDDVMTAREVGDLLHIPGSSVYELARRGALPGHRIGRAWRFIRQEIEDWLRAS